MKRYGIALSLLFVCTVAYPAATIRGIYSRSQSAFASATTVTWTHFVPDQTQCPNNVTAIAAGDDAATISRVTIGGIPATQKAHLTSTETMDWWVVSNSTMTGNQSIVITNNAAVNVYGAAVTFCGALNANPTDSTATQQSTQANPSLAITILSSGSWAVMGMFNNGTTFTNLSQPKINGIVSDQNNGGPSAIAAYIDGPFRSGSNTLSFTQSQSAAWTKAGMGIRPSTGTPILLTDPPTAITATGVTGNGILLSTGGFAVSAFGICVATHPTPTTSDTCSTGSGATPYSVAITGLTPNTLYWVASYATNSEGTDYGYMNSGGIQFVTGSAKGMFLKPGTGNIKATPGLGSSAIQ